MILTYADLGDLAFEEWVDEKNDGWFSASKKCHFRFELINALWIC